MIFRKTPLEGAFVIEPERHIDARGWFSRTWCAREFAARGLNCTVVQSSLSSNNRRGTLRGMHYSIPPHAETKVVRCVRGAIYDVLLDLRGTSPTFRHWYAETLSAENGFSLYVPEGVAHGFQTLSDDTDVLYQMSEFYDAACARGVRWDDAAFRIQWPDGERTLSDRDASYPDARLDSAGPSQLDHGPRFGPASS